MTSQPAHKTERWDPMLLDLAWTVLVEECDAREGGRQDFIASTQVHGLTEYRFMGSLGFGGKLWYRGPSSTQPNGRLYVGCYPEDDTPERQQKIDAANKRLAVLL